MIKGIGKGIGGVIFKPPAGMLTLCVTQSLFRAGISFLTQLHLGLWGLFGYPLVGIRRKLQQSLGKTEELSIMASRIAQGIEDMRASTADDRAEVARKWHLLEEELHASY